MLVAAERLKLLNRWFELQFKELEDDVQVHGQPPPAQSPIKSRPVWGRGKMGGWQALGLSATSRQSLSSFVGADLWELV